jgi:inorganic pyrophosphatase
MTNLLKLPTWADKQHIYAVIETPRGSTCKLDFDPALRVFTLAKPLMAGLTYVPTHFARVTATNALEDKEIEFLGWRGPAHAIKTIKWLSRQE